MSGTPADDDRHYTTGDLARLTGNTLRTVRYYEQLGLLSPAERSDGGHRLFTARDVERLRSISDLRAVGLSLEEVAEVLKVRLSPRDEPGKLPRAATLVDEQLTMVRERINTLTRVERDLAAAKALLTRCMTCPELAQRATCSDCEHLKEAQPNALLSLMLPEGGD